MGIHFWRPGQSLLEIKKKKKRKEGKGKERGKEEGRKKEKQLIHVELSKRKKNVQKGESWKCSSVGE